MLSRKDTSKPSSREVGVTVPAEEALEKADSLLGEVALLKQNIRQRTDELKLLKEKIDRKARAIGRMDHRAAAQEKLGRVEQARETRKRSSEKARWLRELKAQLQQGKTEVNRLRIDEKERRYEASEVIRRARRAQSRQIESAETSPVKRVGDMGLYLFEPDYHDRGQLDRAQWVAIENGKDPSLDIIRLKSVVRAVYGFDPELYRQNLPIALATLDPKQALTAASKEMSRRHGAAFSDCFTVRERRIICLFNRLPATRKHLTANLFNRLFGAAFGRYETGVNWVDGPAKCDLRKSRAVRAAHEAPAAGRHSSPPATLRTRDFGLWVKATRRRKNLSIEKAILLAEEFEGRVSKRKFVGREVSRATWERMELDLDGNPLRGMTWRTESKRQRKWIEAVAVTLSVELSQIEFFDRSDPPARAVNRAKGYARRAGAGSTASDGHLTIPAPASLAVRLSNKQPITEFDRHTCLKPEVFAHNMKRVRSLLDPMAALREADESPHSGPRRLHLESLLLARSVYLDYLLLDLEEQRIVNELFHLPVGEAEPPLFAELDPAHTPEVPRLSGDARRNKLIEFLNLALRLDP